MKMPAVTGTVSWSSRSRQPPAVPNKAAPAGDAHPQSSVGLGQSWEPAVPWHPPMPGLLSTLQLTRVHVCY